MECLKATSGSHPDIPSLGSSETVCMDELIGLLTTEHIRQWIAFAYLTLYPCVLYSVGFPLKCSDFRLGYFKARDGIEVKWLSARERC